MQLPILHDSRNNRYLSRKNINQSNCVWLEISKEDSSRSTKLCLQRYVKASFTSILSWTLNQMLKTPWSTQCSWALPLFSPFELFPPLDHYFPTYLDDLQLHTSSEIIQLWNYLLQEVSTIPTPCFNGPVKPLPQSQNTSLFTSFTYHIIY